MAVVLVLDTWFLILFLSTHYAPFPGVGSTYDKIDYNQSTWICNFQSENFV
jgi:hypothetical protein